MLHSRDIGRSVRYVAFVSPFPISFSARHDFRTCEGKKKARWTCRKGRERGSEAENAQGRNRSAKRSAFYAAMRLYREHFEPLLQAELEAEQIAVLEQRSVDRVRDRRMARGYTLRDLSAKKKKRLFSLNVYSLAPETSAGGLPMAHEFSKGDLINLTPDRLDDDRVVEGTVLAKHSMYLLVTVPIGSEGAMQMDTFVDHNDLLRADCGTSSIAFERALNALISFTTEGPATPDIAKLLIMSLSEVNTIESQATTPTRIGRSGSADVEDEPLDLRRPSHNGADDSETSKWHSFSKETVAKIAPQDLSRVLRDLPAALNTSQVAAIKTALRRRLTLIQGPPGTGKTVTAAHLISSFVELGLGPVLACAASNVASDNLMRKIMKTSTKTLRVVRIGRVPVIDEDLWDKTLESQLEHDPVLRKARDACATGSIKFSELVETEKRITKKILEKADVVVGTCVGCGRDELQELRFQFVVVDEATQASEPDVLIPLSITINNGIQAQLVLVGDQHQLPPTVLSRKQGKIVRMGLETSLFLRLWRNGIDTQLLNVQYRMHPQISKFPSVHFYFKRLLNGIGAAERPLPKIFEKEKANSILLKSRTVFLHVPQGREETDPKSKDTVSPGHSYCNRAEADVILRLLDDLLGYGDTQLETMQAFSPSDIGLISPYAGQVRLLKELLAKKGQHESIEVSTVDGFQGREKNVIVLSSVRSNDEGVVGFLRDWRRLNVAITRARILLVVIGNEDTLCTDSHWRSWLKWVKRNGTTKDSSDPE